MPGGAALEATATPGGAALNATATPAAVTGEVEEADEDAIVDPLAVAAAKEQLRVAQDALDKHMDGFGTAVQGESAGASKKEDVWHLVTELVRIMQAGCNILHNA